MKKTVVVDDVFDDVGVGGVDEEETGEGRG